MKDGLLISVRQEDIDKGIPCSGDSCPVARAIERELSWDGFRSPELRVLSEQIHIDMVEYHVPRSVKGFIRQFDSEQIAKPFNFWLRKE
jgi:hypothetical protein